MADAPERGIGLADAIGLLRDELLKARAAWGADPVAGGVDDGGAEGYGDQVGGWQGGIQGPGRGAGAGRRRGHGSEQTVTVVFGWPVDRAETRSR